jgi:hypothetical protein
MILLSTGRWVEPWWEATEVGSRSVWYPCLVMDASTCQDGEKECLRKL